MNNLYVLIMAGGEGTRFAPLSTPEKPKQFLNFVGNGTFIQQTRRRISPMVACDNIYVATNERYLPLVREQLSDIPEANIITEPVKKNTAPCIAYVSRLIHEKDSEAVLVVLPSDHVILNESKFLGLIKEGVSIARNSDYIVTLGITPDWPATCYGYIKTMNLFKGSAYSVEAFVEKPDESNARKYVDDGQFLWNSGMFIWRTSTILKCFEQHQPEIYSLLDGFAGHKEFKDAFYTKVPSISVDYGVMEKTTKVAVIPCDIGWSDVGTWEGLYSLHSSGSVKISNKALGIMFEQLKLEG